MFNVRVTFSCSKLKDMTNSMIEISEVGVQLPEKPVTLRLNAYTTVCIQLWRNG